MPTAIQLAPQQRLVGRLPKDRFAKKDVAYLVTDRSREWILICQSLPLLVTWINTNLSSGEQWDRVSLSGMFENLDRTDGRHGGWHKGRFRVSSLPLSDSNEVFNAMRVEYKNAAIVGHNMKAG